jgi:hypothetical protein
MVLVAAMLIACSALSDTSLSIFLAHVISTIPNLTAP